MFFFSYLTFLCYGVNKAAGGLFINTILSTYCRLLTVLQAYQSYESHGNPLFPQPHPESTRFSHPLFHGWASVSHLDEESYGVPTWDNLGPSKNLLGWICSRRREEADCSGLISASAFSR